MKSITKYQAATAIALLFHVTGLAGLLFFDRDIFIKATFVNLSLMFVLLIWTQKKINLPFILFALGCIIAGIIAEIIGTKTGWLFGKYAYGDVLGPEIENVPFIIGINWFIIIYCCGICIHSLLTKIMEQIPREDGPDSYREKPVLKAASIIIDGALLAVLFDWIMEPVAIDLGYWSWASDHIPLYNYVCWFIISSVLMSAFHLSSFNKQNKFAVNLLLIQMMFFLILRTLL